MASKDFLWWWSTFYSQVRHFAGQVGEAWNALLREGQHEATESYRVFSVKKTWQNKGNKRRLFRLCRTEYLQFKLCSHKLRSPHVLHMFIHAIWHVSKVRRSKRNIAVWQWYLFQTLTQQIDWRSHHVLMHIKKGTQVIFTAQFRSRS